MVWNLPGQRQEIAAAVYNRSLRRSGSNKKVLPGYILRSVWIKIDPWLMGKPHFQPRLIMQNFGDYSSYFLILCFRMRKKPVAAENYAQFIVVLRAVSSSFYCFFLFSECRCQTCIHKNATCRTIQIAVWGLIVWIPLGRSRSSVPKSVGWSSHVYV